MCFLPCATPSLSASMKHMRTVHIVPSDIANLTKSTKILDYLIPSIAMMNRMNVYTKHNRLCIVNMNTSIEHYVDMPSQLVPLDVCSMTLAYCENSRGKSTITTQSHVHVCNVCPVLVMSVQATRNYRLKGTMYDLRPRPLSYM